MSPRLHRLGRFAARRPWTVIGSWLVVSLLVIAAAGAFGRELEDSFEAPGVDSQKASALLERAGSDRAGLTAQVVLTPRDGRASLDAAPLRRALTRIRARAAALPNVLDAGEPALSPDGRVALIGLRYPVLEALDKRDLERLKAFGAEAGRGSPLRLELNGDLFFAFEEPEAGTAELVGVAAAAVILLVAFGSLVAMGLPIVVALLGVALGAGSLTLVAHLVAVPSWAPQLAAMVGLGVGIDYALILLTRHREYLAAGLGVEESIGRAVATAGRVVVFAGGTVVVAILGLAVAGLPFLTGAGVAVATVVLVLVAAAVTLLPALLGLAGPWIERLSVRPRRAAAGSAASPRWTRWGRHVTRHPWPYAIGVAVGLLALAAPALDLRMGNPDEGVLPESRTERRAYDLAAAGFGPGINGPLVVAADVAGDPGVVEPLERAIERDDGIAGVAAPEVDRAAGVATLVAQPTTGPQADATRATLDRLRADVIPGALAGRPARAHVGGQAAVLADVSDRVADRLPLFVAAVVGVSLLLLILVFRSVVVPLKAAAMNLLSVGAAYGVLVLVFQWGWGAELIGLESTIPVVPFIPMFMFAILFGLSMDYEVFLLSRVREEHLATGDCDAAVIRGLAGTARVITSAASIMVCVFLAFVLSDDPTTKMFGLGLATAILIDATVIRIVLVPAVMSLLGERAWWLPGWLDRLLPEVAVEAPETEPSPEPVNERAKVLV